MGDRKKKEKKIGARQGARWYIEKKTQTDKKLSSGIIVWLVTNLDVSGKLEAWTKKREGHARRSGPASLTRQQNVKTVRLRQPSRSKEKGGKKGKGDKPRPNRSRIPKEYYPSRCITKSSSHIRP